MCVVANSGKRNSQSSHTRTMLREYVLTEILMLMIVVVCVVCSVVESVLCVVVVVLCVV